jgi:leader peptidase (prepilin peptidase) / N-methyltransferase
MSDWMVSEITLRFAPVVIGMLAGRLCVGVLSWLPAVLEHQWQRDAQELLGLSPDQPLDLQVPGVSRPEIWIVQIGCAGLSLLVAAIRLVHLSTRHQLRKARAVMTQSVR